MQDRASASSRERHGTETVGKAPPGNCSEHVGDSTQEGLLVAVERIAAARNRGGQPSDGGSTGKTDMNDG